MPITKHWKYNEDVVKTSIKGVCHGNPHLKLLEEERVVFNAKPSPNKIAVLSGGGSGHEPLHAGFVGDNLLDVAVCGSVFASPAVKQIVAGLNTVPTEKGAIVIVKNYTGDILHFGLASERAKAANMEVELLIVQDDVAVGRTKNGFVGRRGLAGTALVHKIVGGLAGTDDKIDVKGVAKLGQQVIESLVTIGASLDHVTIPGTSAANNNDDDDDEEKQLLGADEIEIGMGIHNEPGIKRVSPIPTVDQLVEQLLNYLLDPNDKERYYVDFEKDDEVVLLVNNLGSTSNLELYAIQSVVMDKLKSDWGIVPVRVLTGTFTTSLDGPGISITLMNVTKAGGKRILDLLDLPTNAPAWNSSFSSSDWSSRGDFIINELPQVSQVSSNIKFDPKTIDAIIRGGAKNIIEVEPKVTWYDTVAGDGDCGETLVAGVNGLVKALDDKSLNLTDAVKSLDEITDIVESTMGGTSGGLYSIFISSMNTYLKAQDDAGKYTLDVKVMAKALEAGLKGLQRYTKAQVGDRTLMDALIPFVETLSETGDIQKAVKSAHDGAENTRKYKAKFGRASYVGEDEFKQFEKEGGLPDPGAIGLAALLTGFVDALS